MDLFGRLQKAEDLLGEKNTPASTTCAQYRGVYRPAVPHGSQVQPQWYFLSVFMCSSARVCMCTVCALVPAETSRGNWNSWNWNCSWFQAARWVLGIRSRFCARASTGSLPASLSQFLWPFPLMYMCMWAHMYVLMHMNVHAYGDRKLASDAFSIPSYFIYFI